MGGWAVFGRTKAVVVAAGIAAGFASSAGVLVPALPEHRCLFVDLFFCSVDLSAGSPALRACSFRLCRNIAVFLDSSTERAGSSAGSPALRACSFRLCRNIAICSWDYFLLSEIAGRLTNAARPGIRLPSAGRGFARRRNPSNPPRDVRRHITWGRQNKNARISGHFCFGVPRGIRTPVLTVKG